MSWDRLFDPPVPLPNGRPARTLRDAADYIRKLSTSERFRQEWRLAVHTLIEAAENRGPMVFARMGLLYAIDRDAEPRFESRRRRAKLIRLGRRKLARNR